MRGHVYKRGTSWTVVYDEHAEEGKRRQRSKGGFTTRKEAQRFVTDTLARIDAGSYAAPSKLTVADYLEREWLPAVEGTLRPLSIQRYRSVIRLYVKPRIGSQRLQASLAARSTPYAELEQAGLSVSTRRLVHAVIGRALRDAERWGRVPRNVARMADPPSREGSRVQAWTARGAAPVPGSRPGRPARGVMAACCDDGMRRGELAGLTWRALDLGGARLHVDQQLVPTRGGASFGAPKTTRSRRTVALDPETVAVLRAHRETQLLERDFAGPAYVDRDLVFADQLGGATHPQRLTEGFAKQRRAAGIPTGSLHVLRHTAATLALTAGVPVHIVAARLGDDPKQILTTYAHLLPQSDELAAERIAAAIA